jgi:hypothetical protein
MTMPENLSPGVLMLDAFSRDSAYSGTERLAYPKLERIAAEARAQEMALLDEFWDAEEGSVLEDDRARKAAIGYLVLTGLQLHSVPEEHQEEIARRFTQASVELYGAPDEQEFQYLLHEKIHEFTGYASQPGVDHSRIQNVLSVLSPRISETDGSKNKEHANLHEAAKQLTDAMHEKFRDVLAVFDDLDPSDDLTPEKVAKLYEKGRNILASQDDTWNTWSVVLGNTVAMSAEAETKEITVGKKHDPMKPAKAIQLFCHEVLVHAQRAVNGRKSGDRMLEHGLPGSLDAEEGLAVFIEYGLSGEVPAVRTDRHVDFGLALGLSGGKPLTRRELHQLYVDRSVVRKQANGTSVDLEKIAASGWRYVNRIYRGSLENDVISVNTKDLAYYNGFLKIGNYVANELKKGASAVELLDRLLIGKYDPTNPKHRDYVAKVSKD